MVESDDGYAPQGGFRNRLCKLPQFCDVELTDVEDESSWVYLPQVLGKSAQWKLYEMENLIDSSNMDFQGWKDIATIVE